VVNFTLQMLKAISQNEGVPEPILISLAVLIESLIQTKQQVKLTKEHFSLALQWVPFMRSCILEVYLRSFSLGKIVDSNYLKALVQKEITGKRLGEATTFMIRFNMLDHFNIREILLELALDSNNQKAINSLLAQRPEFTHEIIETCCTPADHKMATALIKANKLREADFPRLMEI